MMMVYNNIDWMNFGWMSGVRPWVGFRSVEGRKETYVYFRKITKREKNGSHRVCSGRRQVCAEASGQAPSCMRSARLGLRWIVVRRRQKSRQAMKCARRSLYMTDLHSVTCARCARRMCSAGDDREAYTPERDETSVSFFLPAKVSVAVYKWKSLHAMN